MRKFQLRGPEIGDVESNELIAQGVVEPTP
jgi:hypothetical protein